MKIDFIDTNLHEMDEVETQVIIASAFQEERPFHGVAGLIDWRMCTAFARMALDNFLTSRLGEAVMVPSYGRFNATGVIMLGLGSDTGFGENEMKVTATKISGLIRGMHLNTVMIDLPGSPISRIRHAKRMNILMDALKNTELLTTEEISLFIVENARFHREMRSIVKKFNTGNRGRRYA